MNIASGLSGILNGILGQGLGSIGGFNQQESNPIQNLLNVFMGILGLSLLASKFGQQGGMSNSIFGGGGNNFGQFDGFSCSGGGGYNFGQMGGGYGNPFMNMGAMNGMPGMSGTSGMTSPIGQGTCKPKAQGLDKNFLNEVKAMAGRLNCNYQDLLGVMNSESGLNAQAVNGKSGATGLIQFMPSTARSLGTSTEELRNMSPTQQLKYVEKFLQTNIKSRGLQGKQLSPGDLYALVFMPAKAGKEVITSAGSKAYSWNKGLDSNHDGVITNSELGQRVINKRVDESIFV